MPRLYQISTEGVKSIFAVHALEMSDNVGSIDLEFVEQTLDSNNPADKLLTHQAYPLVDAVEKTTYSDKS
ncbi:hypothetical protein FQR65_LT02091 [Abscondita terminalis]|nr:hypothetical protein FQR65_LT02091 [Abscondita terminalis]